MLVRVPLGEILEGFRLGRAMFDPGPQDSLDPWAALRGDDVAIEFPANLLPVSKSAAVVSAEGGR